MQLVASQVTQNCIPACFILEVKQQIGLTAYQESIYNCDGIFQFLTREDKCINVPEKYAEK